MLKRGCSVELDMTVLLEGAQLGRPKKKGDGSVSDGTRVGNSVGVADGLGLGDLVVGASVGVHVDVPIAIYSSWARACALQRCGPSETRHY